MGRAGLFALVVALTAVGAYVGSGMGGPAGAVVGAVSGVGVSVLGEAGRRRLDSLQNCREMRERVFLPSGEENSYNSRLSPASMLVADRAIVPFVDREQELGDLINWCKGWSADPLRLLVGAGGTGKTRLARELAARLSGWDCVWVRVGQEADALKAARRRKSLVIVEYAETKPRANLAKLLWDLAWPPGKRTMPSLIVARGIRGSSDDFAEPDRRQVRVLLIARAMGDWWDELGEKAETFREQLILENAKHARLGSLAYGGHSFRRHYDEAIRAFSQQLNISPPATASVDIHEDAPILVIHMAALVAVLGFEGLPPDQRDELLSRLLMHEERYWARSIESYGLASLPRAARRQSVAELCLSGVVSQSEADELLKRVPYLAGEADAAARSSVVRWLQALFPGNSPDELGSLQPYLLAEYLVVRELTDHAFFSSALSGLPEDRAHRAFTVLGYATQYDQRAGLMIREAVEEDRDQMILPAISAAVDTGASLDSAFTAVLQGMSIDVPQLIRLSAAIPLEPRSLNGTAAVIRDKLAEVGIVELRRIGKIKGGAKEIERRQALLLELARVYEFAKKNGRSLPASFRSDLLKALGRQQRALAGSGQVSEAQGISRRIMQIEAPSPPSSQV